MYSLVACSDDVQTESDNYDTDFGSELKISESTLIEVAKSEVSYAVYKKIDSNKYSYGCDPNRTKVEYTDYDMEDHYSYSEVTVRGKCWLYNSYNDCVDIIKFDCRVDIYNNGTVKQCYFPSIYSY